MRSSKDQPEAPSPIPDALVADILAGCEGVTNGPWCSRKAGDKFSVEDHATRHVALLQHAQLNREIDAAHIARLDPHTVHSILTRLQYLESLDRWQPIETAPVNGPLFIAWVIDRVDEYDEDDRLIQRGKRVGSAVIAQSVSFTGGRGEVVEVPWKFVQGRDFTHWQPLPTPPSAGVQS